LAPNGKRGVLDIKLAFLIGAVWSIYTLSYLCNLFFYLGLIIYPLTHRAISAGLICILTLLIISPAKKRPPGNLKPWYDIVPIIIIIAGCSYVAVNANDLVAEGRLICYPYEMVLASLLFLTVIEAARRTVGWILSGIIIFSFLYAVYSNLFPGFFAQHRFFVSDGVRMDVLEW